MISTTDLDKRFVWHPYNTVIDPDPVYSVVSAAGVKLKLEDGTELIDGMSSWWCMIHGYNNPVLNQALSKQAEQMSHVMFGGLTHKPAAELAELLVKITPAHLDRVFYADSGSVAVEVAIKMAIQYWFAKGKPKKHQFVALRNAYHGDTFAAMALCDPITSMHSLFSGVLPKNYFVEQPLCTFNETCNNAHLQALESLLADKHEHIAALVVEPIVQGAGGMYFYSPDYLKGAKALCERFNVLLIADEIATGFGRTGKLFACEHANISPDILCLGKALTGGYLTLSATLCSNQLAQTICSHEPGTFMHGPTFMGNPLACAVAIASIQLLLNSPWQQRISAIEQQLSKELGPLTTLSSVKEVRCLGAIGVVEMHEAVDMNQIIPLFVAQGIWVRPFGKLVYLMPPYIISVKELSELTTGVSKVLTELAKEG